jgi:hypothetical protein
VPVLLDQQIASTDASGPDLHQDLAGADLGDRYLAQLYVADPLFCLA